MKNTFKELGSSFHNRFCVMTLRGNDLLVDNNNQLSLNSSRYRKCSWLNIPLQLRTYSAQISAFFQLAIPKWGGGCFGQDLWTLKSEHVGATWWLTQEPHSQLVLARRRTLASPAKRHYVLFYISGWKLILCGHCQITDWLLRAVYCFWPLSDLDLWY